MEFLGELCLFNKAKSMISSLSGMVMLWATRSPSPMQTPLIKVGDNRQLAGLKTLIYTQPKCSHHQQIPILHSYMANSAPPPPKTTPPSVPPSSPSSSAMLSRNTWSSSSLALDDLIGTDSGVNLISSDFDIGQITTSAENNNTNKHFSYKDRIHDKRASERASAANEGEKYPPPIPWLARAGNAAAGRSIPWVWTRHYKDGRLILHCQPLERHEYFEARRDNGRLILDLVSIENRNIHRTRLRSRSRSRSRLRSLTRSYREEELIQFGEEEEEEEEEEDDDDETNDEDDQSVAVLESLVECFGADPKGLTYACGMCMDMHERRNAYSMQASSSAPPVLRPMTSVIM